jgi:hypothetical protein
VLKWVGIAAACALTLTACTVPPGGVVGVTVDAQGKPVIVVQMCEGHIDGATMYREDETFGKWEVSSPVTGFSQFDLDTGGNGWAVVGDLVGRDPKLRYTIYGWSKDNSRSANHLDFSEQELAELKPGTVLVPERKAEGNRRRSLQDFKDKTCDEW